MTKRTSEVNGPVALKNVAAFMVMTQRLVDRDPHLPGIGVFSGPSGFGKSYAAIYAQNKTRAIRVEVGDSWTRKTFLFNVMSELGVAGRAKRLTVPDMAMATIEALGDDASRPLIIDEADKLVDKGFIELVRELHEHSGVPVILIGEERLPQKLLSVERMHNRVLDWQQAQECDAEDTDALAAAFAPKLEIGSDLLDRIRAMSAGRARRIVVNLARVAEYAANKGLKHIDLKKWNDGDLYTGEPPQARPVEMYKRARVAA